MVNKEYIQNDLAEVGKIAEAIPVADIDRAIEVLFEAWRNGNHVFACGNGGFFSVNRYSFRL